MNRLINLLARRHPGPVYLRPETPTMASQPRHWVALAKALAARPEIRRHQVQSARQD